MDDQQIFGTWTPYRWMTLCLQFFFFKRLFLWPPFEVQLLLSGRDMLFSPHTVSRLDGAGTYPWSPAPLQNGGTVLLGLHGSEVEDISLLKVMSTICTLHKEVKKHSDIPKQPCCRCSVNKHPKNPVEKGCY